MKELLNRLNFDQAYFDRESNMLMIPFLLEVGDGKFKAHVAIPSSEEWHACLVYALREELRK